MIDKNTKLYGSFSKEAGSLGCTFFNRAFKEHNINAIYKSFSVSNIFDAYHAAKVLNFSGFAVAMPFKKQIYDIIKNDLPPNFDLTQITMKQQIVINTVILTNTGHAIPYNTDYIAAIQLTKELDYSIHTIIAGDGGLGSTIWQAIKTHTNNFTILSRAQLHQLQNQKNSTIIIRLCPKLH